MPQVFFPVKGFSLNFYNFVKIAFFDFPAAQLFAIRLPASVMSLTVFSFVTRLTVSNVARSLY
jgi:hypothetical protein